VVIKTSCVIMSQIMVFFGDLIIDLRDKDSVIMAVKCYRPTYLGHKKSTLIE